MTSKAAASFLKVGGFCKISLSAKKAVWVIPSEVSNANEIE